MKKKKGQALKVSKDPNAFISPWMCHLFLCQIDSNICKAKKHSGVQVQEDGHEEIYDLRSYITAELPIVAQKQIQ